MGGGVRSAGSSLGKTFGKLFVLGAGVVAAAGIGSFLKGSIDEAREAQKVGAQTNAVLKSTGQVANVSSTQIGKLASSLSAKIGVDDEAIQAGENMLLTFTNVRNEVGKNNNIFAQATTTVQDMAAAFGGDAVSNSKILGKALNDPAKGVSALTKVGVTFTDKQKEQIKTFQESGNILGAQKIILRELGKETKGSAEAQATAGDKARVALGNLKETIGTALLPLVDTLARQFLRFTPAIQKGIAGIGPAMKRVRGYIAPLVAIVASVVAQVVPKLISVARAIIATVIPAAQNLIKFVRPLAEDLLNIVPGATVSALSGLANLLQTVVGPAIISVTGFIAQHGDAFRALAVGVVAMIAAFKLYQVTLIVIRAATAAYAAVQAVLNAVLTANPIGLIILALVGLAAGLVYAYKKSDTFRAVVDAAFSAIKKVVASVIGFIVPFVKNHWKLLVAIIGGPVAAIVVLVVTHFGTIKKVVSAAVDFVVGQAKGFAKFASLVIEHVQKVTTFFRQLPGKIKGFLTSLPGELKTIGGNIIDGLVSGIKAAAHKVEDAVKAIIDKIPKKIRSIMGIASPSKVTTDLGRFIGDGLAKGIADRTDKVGDAVDKVGKKLKEKIAKLRDSLSSVRSDFASLVEPIASNFTQGLFDFDTAGAFTANLTTVKGTLQTLLANFAKLKGEGLSPGFLYQLFQAGGPGLINSLAGLDAASANAAASDFGQITDLSNQLGTAVAGATSKGADLEKQTATLTKKLDQLIKATHDNAREVADALNGPAGRARRRAVHA